MMMCFLLKMVIFQCYVSLPEGMCLFLMIFFVAFFFGKGCCNEIHIKKNGISLDVRPVLSPALFAPNAMFMSPIWRVCYTSPG